MNSNELPVFDSNEAANYIQDKFLKEHHELLNIDLIGAILNYETEYMELIGLAGKEVD
jgi:hypothetical protein